ncbi:hypothetical protein GU243_08720 [Pseudarthrobacter psychrotolerans]|uniref:SDR family oxidoreductase n=1 Tax=Pseudarthrobacter psychrotolerans TaxID=2697569 RepID=A0A6P1NMW6_9MICC|nr:hypothetical protein [Pseudarthrobacter psychrotolerans]QHK19800.1 hypothetical protein GU243_08720 [Pseudarthrobacter psychrotolerans]
MAERGARIKSLGPGIISAPLAQDWIACLTGDLPGYDHRVRCGSDRNPSEIEDIAAWLLGPNGAFVTASDLLIGGVKLVPTTVAVKFVPEGTWKTDGTPDGETTTLFGRLATGRRCVRCDMKILSRWSRASFRVLKMRKTRLIALV